jgi:Leucine-rich repeat (LRR) protein
LSGNPITHFKIVAETRDEIVKEWIIILASLTNVHRVKFPGCYIDDKMLCALAATLETFQNLWELELGGNKFKNVTCLAGLSNVKDLHLANNIIDTVKPLATLLKLTDLQLSGNRLTNVSLNTFVNLKYLHLDDNSIRTIEGLDALVQLEWLLFKNNQISEINMNFAPLVRLQKLDLSMNKISNVTSLRTLPNLPELKLRVILTGNPIHQAHILSLREELMNVMIDF